MKLTALAILLLAASSAIAKPRDWKPATVTLISYDTEQTGAVVMPLYAAGHHSLYAMPLLPTPREDE